MSACASYSKVMSRVPAELPKWKENVANDFGGVVEDFRGSLKVSAEITFRKLALSTCS